MEHLRVRIWEECESLGLPTNEKLPVLEDSLHLRPMQEIVSRSMALHAVVSCAFGFPPGKAKAWLEANRLTGFLTGGEADALERERNLDPYQREVHALYALAWVMGRINGYTATADIPNSLITTLPDLKGGESYDEFSGKVTLRDEDTVISELDRAYCIHWALVENRLRGVQPRYAGIPERRLALEWCLSQEAWDEISLDT